MNTSFKTFAIRSLAVCALAVAAFGSANAAIFFRTGVVVAPVARVVVAPTVVAAPVIAAPVIAAPVMIVPTCRFVAIPVVNAWTGLTYMVTRRVCN